MQTKQETLKDFQGTLRRNPHYKGSGGFQMMTLHIIEDLLENAAHNERLIEENRKPPLTS